MIEFLALPAVDTPPTSLEAWRARLGELGHPAVFTRDGSDGGWLEVASLRLRGYAVLMGRDLEAINFEVHAPDPSACLRLLEAAALALRWEIHPNDDEDDEDPG